MGMAAVFVDFFQRIFTLTYVPNCAFKKTNSYLKWTYKINKIEQWTFEYHLVVDEEHNQIKVSAINQF